jgi:hypothetical protein
MEGWARAIRRSRSGLRAELWPNYCLEFFAKAGLQDGGTALQAGGDGLEDCAWLNFHHANLDFVP